jgi:Mrp family chromosome partitioning ATPase
MEGTQQMSKILTAMQKSSADGVDFTQRLKAIDRGNLFPLPAESQVPEFEQLANSLINLHGGTGGKTLVFASTYAGEGSSYVSYNCARYLTLLLDRKVAWIDGNFRNPHKKVRQLDLNFFDLLNDPSQLPEMDKGPELVIVGNGKKPGKTMDLITGPNYPKLIQHLQDNFYFTIIDSAPTMESVEVAHLAQEALGMVLVVESQRLKYEVIQHGIDKMRSQNVNILGTVLNKRTFHLPDFLYKRL